MISFSVWTIPIQEQSFPFGEGDAAHQFGIADAISHFDRVTFEHEFHIAAWYPFFAGGFFARTNAPYFMINSAIMQITGGERFIPIHLYYAVICNFFVVLGIYLIMRKSYGFNHAIVSGFFLIFPLRNALSYLWGQRTHLIALAYVPVVLYAYLRYLDSCNKGKEKPTYLYISAVLAAASGFFHPAGLSIMFFSLTIFTTIIWIRERKFPINIKNLVIALVLFGILFGPFVPGYISSKIKSADNISFELTGIGSLFSWTGPGASNQAIQGFSDMHGGYWIVPFMVIGISFILLRRKMHDYLMLSWLAGLYLALHLGVIGINFVGVDRVLKGSSHIFYPLAVIGIFGIVSFIKIKKRYLNAAVSLVLIFTIITINAVPVADTFKGAYPPILRITPYQYEASQWIDKNLDEYSIIYSIGSITYPKMRWMHVLSHRATMTGISSTFEEASETVSSFPMQDKITHIMVDYSDLYLLGQQDKIDALKSFENAYANQSRIVYDKNNIKVYELE